MMSDFWRGCRVGGSSKIGQNPTRGVGRFTKSGMSSGPDAEDYLDGDLSQVSQSPFLKDNVMQWALFKLPVCLRTSRASKNLLVGVPFLMIFLTNFLMNILKKNDNIF